MTHTDRQADAELVRLLKEYAATEHGKRAKLHAEIMRRVFSDPASLADTIKRLAAPIQGLAVIDHLKMDQVCPHCGKTPAEGPEPPAPLDEARMRDILDETDAELNPGPRASMLAGYVTKKTATTAMSLAISEARAEQRERDAKIAGYFAEIYWSLSPAKSAAAATAAAIRSQNDPDEQGE